jgi:fatty acid desaturase
MTDNQIIDAEGQTGFAVSPEALAPLMVRQDAPAIARMSGHLTVLVAMMLFVAALRGTIWVLPAMVAQGVAMVFLFAPLHECIHRTAFKSRFLNDGFGLAIGILLLLPREYFRAFHFAHHRHTQDPANDPELVTPKPHSLREWMLTVSGALYWRHQAIGLWRHAMGIADEAFLRDDAAREKIIVEARLMMVIYVALAAASIAWQSAALLWYWILPVVLGQPFLRLYLLAEHTLCPLVPNMLKNSRTTLSNEFVRFFAWNMPYHAEHHVYPGVPFHQLPALHGILSPYLGCVAEGFWSASREIFRGLER